MNTSHPNVLELIAVELNPQNRIFCLISELMVNGNIVDYIRVTEANRIRLVWHFPSLALSYTLNIPKLEDVAKGLRHLHKNRIIHGDLKGVSLQLFTPTTCRGGSVLLTRRGPVLG